MLPPTARTCSATRASRRVRGSATAGRHARHPRLRLASGRRRRRSASPPSSRPTPCSHAFGQMRQITSIVFEGIPERFPDARIAFLEAGCGWAPYWMERMDDEYAKRAAEAPVLKKKPSDYVRRGQDLLLVRGRRVAPAAGREAGRREPDRVRLGLPALGPLVARRRSTRSASAAISTIRRSGRFLPTTRGDFTSCNASGHSLAPSAVRTTYLCDPLNFTPCG